MSRQICNTNQAMAIKLMYQCHQSPLQSKVGNRINTISKRSTVEAAQTKMQPSKLYPFINEAKEQVSKPDFTFSLYLEWLMSF